MGENRPTFKGRIIKGEYSKDDWKFFIPVVIGIMISVLAMFLAYEL